MATITQDQAKRLIHDQGQKVFGVTFIKNNGDERRMNCRLNVKSHLKGGELSYDPAKYNLLPVFDMQKGDYRSINFSTIKELRANGEIFEVIG